MPAGSPGFINERLRQLREARGLSGTALSDLIGVSRASISLYEKGKATPGPQTVSRLANVLRVPERFFWAPAPNLDQTRIFFRSMSAATKSARASGKRRSEWVREAFCDLSKYVRFPQPDIPKHEGDPFALDEFDIESIAASTRKCFGIGTGPIANVVRLLESRGIVVTRLPLNANTLDAFSQWDQSLDWPFVILNSDKACCVRSRFDAAHELAHLVLHRELDEKRILDKTQNKEIENQAHRFAGAFLLPSESFANDLFVPTLEALLQLKKKWRVSIAMMIKRGQDLNLITDANARRLWIALARRGWRKAEPFDDEWQPEAPSLLKSAVELLVEKGIQTREQIKWNSPIDSQDFERICGLAPKFLSRADGSAVVSLQVRGESRNYKNQEGSGEIVRFPENQ